MTTRKKILEAPSGEDTSSDGTEAFPVTGNKYMLVSTVAAYIRTLVQTLTNKTIDLTSNTLTGTKAQFNTAMSDDNFVTLTGSEVLTNKTLTAPTIADFTNAGHDHGDADDGGTVAESVITFTDITTNNASTSKHGFLKKLDNDNTHFMDGTGAWSAPVVSASVATDAIWDAKGDLAGGTGANTAARLAVGTNGFVLTADSGEATGMKWATGGAGDFVGPGASTDNAVVRFDSTTGKLGQNSVMTVDDSGSVNIPSGQTYSVNSVAMNAAKYITAASSAALSAEIVIPSMAGSADIAGQAGGGVSYEFDSGISPLTWSAAVDAEDVNSTVLSHLYISDNGASETLGTYAWAPAGAFDIRCKLLLGFDALATGAGAGLVVGDSAMNNRVLLFFGLDTSLAPDALTISAYSYASSTYTLRGSAVHHSNSTVYLRIVRDGSNNNSFYWSSNGIMWAFIVTQALTYTAAKAGLRVSAGSAVQKIAVDWIRSDV
jgi:hypothetical protein